MVFEQILEKILDYKGNRYELARACMEYAKCVRYLNKDEDMGASDRKEVLLAIEDVLNNKIKYTSDKFQIEIHQDEVEFMRTFKNMEEKKLSDAQSETEELSATDTALPVKNAALEEEDDQPYIAPKNPSPPETEVTEQIEDDED